MIRFSFALAVIAAVSATSGLQAQQVIYSGEIIYSQPIYPVVQPQHYYSYEYFPAGQVMSSQVAPYPVEYQTSGVVVLSNQVQQPVVQQPLAESRAVTVTEQKNVNVAPANTVKTANRKGTQKTALPTYRKSSTVQTQPVSNVRPTQIYSQPAISSPVIQYQQPAPVMSAPNYFAPQNCFSGR